MAPYRRLVAADHLVMSLVLLTVVLVINTYAARWLGFNTADEITIVFCGSKEPANGIPMANVLFPAAAVGAMVLPLMIFHQVQLMVCAVLAQRYARKTAKQRAEAEALLVGASGGPARRAESRRARRVSARQFLQPITRSAVDASIAW